MSVSVAASATLAPESWAFVEALVAEGKRRMSIPELREMKDRGEKISMLTAYDYPTARLLDEAGVDVLLVGDSLGMVVLGYDSTVYVTLEEMIHHVKAVVRGTQGALVIGDLPFGSYNEDSAQAIRSATRLMKEGGCAAVKLEGGVEMAPTVRAVVDAGIPVVGHVGLLPQTATKVGGYKVQARTAEDALALVQSGRALEKAGAFMVVVEAVPAPVGTLLSRSLAVPVIGIGAGVGCDGQVLVAPDMLGLQEDLAPRYLKRYAHLAGTVGDAVRRYVSEVKAGAFPAEEHVYPMDPEEEAKLGS
ncbi:MAG: 3-methyl-2-oxobutanoate hydroxymethyltransferase [Actinomycetota bacterium]|nr:3-methyl-2-oxobutanoate hydroxymethyltransferase [Actinomycetota bacterium]